MTAAKKKRIEVCKKNQTGESSTELGEWRGEHEVR